MGTTRLGPDGDELAGRLRLDRVGRRADDDVEAVRVTLDAGRADAPAVAAMSVGGRRPAWAPAPGDAGPPRRGPEPPRTAK